MMHWMKAHHIRQPPPLFLGVARRSVGLGGRFHRRGSVCECRRLPPHSSEPTFKGGANGAVIAFDARAKELHCALEIDEHKRRD